VFVVVKLAIQYMVGAEPDKVKDAFYKRLALKAGPGNSHELAEPLDDGTFLLPHGERGMVLVLSGSDASASPCEFWVADRTFAQAELADSRGHLREVQMKSYAFDVVRSHIPTMDLDEAYADADTMAQFSMGLLGLRLAQCFSAGKLQGNRDRPQARDRPIRPPARPIRIFCALLHIGPAIGVLSVVDWPCGQDSRHKPGCHRRRVRRHEARGRVLVVLTAGPVSHFR
jgi:hypothetical protein